MRIQKIVCDRCGKEITGYPVEIFPRYVDRECGEESWPDRDDPLPDWAEKMRNTEFCERCTEKIVRFALGGLKENPEFEQAVQEMIKSDTPPPLRQGMMIRYQTMIATKKGKPVGLKSIPVR